MFTFVWIVRAWSCKARCFSDVYKAKDHKKKLSKIKRIKDNRITVSIVKMRVW